MRSDIALKAAIAALVTSAQATSKHLRKLESKALQKTIDIDNLMAKAQALQDIAYATPGRNRDYKTIGHNHTVDWIVKELKDATGDYYDIEVAPTEFIVPRDPAPFVYGGVTYEGKPMSKTEGGPFGEVDAPVVVVANLGCDAADYPAELEGAIALIARGTCTFELKSQLAGSAGAVGALIYNPEGNYNVVAGTLGVGEGTVPTIGIHYDNATTIKAHLVTNPDDTGALSVVTYVQYSMNVIATSKGGDQNNIYVLGAHADSVEAGPGINDDGSGTIALLEIASQLSRFEVKNAVRFAWWTGEEYGKLGSFYYTDHLTPVENARIRLYNNFDMVASPNYVLGIYDGDGSAFNLSGPTGSAEAERLFEDYFTAEGLPFTASEFSGRSDYAGFIDAGIPSGGLFSGADGNKTAEEAALFGGQAGIIYDPNYHTALDTVDNLNPTCFMQMTKAIAHSVAVYGRSWEGFPPRNNTVSVRKRWMDKNVLVKHHHPVRTLTNGELNVASSGCAHAAEFM
ncbi:aminopeptidase Y [Xylariaceae sp. FL1272]|nr:aminopeptidase Y [Xylariaceae sp. FL1272]